jgi:hypothetical protein
MNIQYTLITDTGNYCTIEQQYYKKGCRVFHDSLSGF